MNNKSLFVKHHVSFIKQLSFNTDNNIRIHRLFQENLPTEFLKY